MTSLLNQWASQTVTNDTVTADRNTEAVSFATPLLADDLPALLEFSSEALVIYDSDFRFLQVNREAERQIGYGRADLIGNAAWKLFPDAIAPYWDTLLCARDERISLSFEVEDPDRKRWTKGRCVPVRYNGDERCVAVFYADRADRRETERSRTIQNQALGILNRVSDAFIAIDPQGYITLANPRANELAGFAGKSLVGRNIWEAWPALQDTNIESEYRRVMGEKETAQSVFEHFFETTGRWLEIQAYSAPQGGLYTVLREITEQKLAEAEQQHLLSEAMDRANHDPLTGLLNHSAFYDQLNAEIARTQREDGTLTLVLMDVDYFKFFNEAFGHQVGDEVLRQIARTLRACCRKSDYLGRLGGDEFALIVDGSADRVIEEIRAIVNRGGFIPSGSCLEVPLGCSLGSAVYPAEAASAQEMVSLADQRLSDAKRSEWRQEANRFFEELRQNQEGFLLLDALVTAVDNKDRYTRKHSEDVLAHAQTIAERLGVSAEERETLRIASLFHDVGKIGVPDHILRRPSHLSPQHYEIIKKHPMMGAAIIGAVPGMERTLAAVRHHHEAWDGSGYPDGLVGESIPLAARILAVADAFSAMTTDRPYRKGMSRDEARRVLQQGSGKQWDARIVSVVLSDIDDF